MAKGVGEGSDDHGVDGGLELAPEADVGGGGEGEVEAPGIGRVGGGEGLLEDGVVEVERDLVETE